jgi:hypothetical protein
VSWEGELGGRGGRWGGREGGLKGKEGELERERRVERHRGRVGRHWVGWGGRKGGLRGRGEEGKVGWERVLGGREEGLKVVGKLGWRVEDWVVY